MYNTIYDSRERVKLKLSNKNLHTGQRRIVPVERVRERQTNKHQERGRDRQTNSQERGRYKQTRERERQTDKQPREREIQTDKREGETDRQTAKR